MITSLTLKVLQSLQDRELVSFLHFQCSPQNVDCFSTCKLIRFSKYSSIPEHKNIILVLKFKYLHGDGMHLLNKQMLVTYDSTSSSTNADQCTRLLWTQ